MEISIKITPSEMIASIENGTLKTFLNNAAQDEKEVKAAHKEVHAPAPVNTITVQPEPTPEVNPTIQTQVTEKPEPLNVTPTPAFNPLNLGQPAAATETTDGPTIDDVRAVFAPIIKAQKFEAVQALYAEFNAQKLTDIDPADYATLIERAKTI